VTPAICTNNRCYREGSDTCILPRENRTASRPGRTISSRDIMIIPGFFYTEGGETLEQNAQRGGHASFLETFKARLDGALSNCIRLEMFLLITGGLD